MAAVAPQRFKRANPCPICGGGDDMPRAKGQRCSGYLSADGRYAYCTREEHAGRAQQQATDPPSYRHLLEGECRCGQMHAPERRSDIDAAYDYLDAGGHLVYQVVRLSGKRFRQRRPGPDGSWLWNLDGVTRVLYRLPDILSAAASGETIYICEGEKDVHAVERAGGVATCNPGGAGKWKPQYAAHLAGADIIIVADNDPPGRDHALNIAATVPAARIVQAAAGKDAHDHLAAGHDLSGFLPLNLEPPEPDLEPPSAITDLENAIRLVAAHGGALRYCDPWGRWLHWQPPAWQEDTTCHVEALAQQTMRELLAEAARITDDKLRAKTLREVRAAERSSRIRGTIVEARARPGIPIQPEQLDADPWLFNCCSGTIDLRTGELHDHDPALLITKAAPCDHDPAAQAPAWQAFLARILPDPALRDFLQRAAGYSMTGLTTEQVLLILYGAGANGKSTFLETLRALLGPYGQQAPPETFLDRREGIPNDIARLRGARMVAAVEISEGRRLNEALVKRMTGGDTMTARFMRAEYFEFKPQFTPWLATNHRPEIRGVDEAIWRRIRLIPFLETIPEAERDPHLQDKLRAELPGILNWALDGCLAWQADGLNTPPAVAAATGEYRGEMDLIGAYLEDCCQQDPAARCRAAELYTAYVAHAKANGNDPAAAQTFGRRLAERGFKRVQSRAGRTWEGLRLLSDQETLEI